MTATLGVRQDKYEMRASAWTRAKELLSDRVFDSGDSRTAAELELARFILGE